jgi:hypothetical protein
MSRIISGILFVILILGLCFSRGYLRSYFYKSAYSTDNPWMVCIYYSFIAIVVLAWIIKSKRKPGGSGR